VTISASATLTSRRRRLALEYSKAFLRPIKYRSNLTTWTNSRVKKLKIERDNNGALRCTGAEIVRNGELVSVNAAREVVLSAGAIGSPHILQHSGYWFGVHIEKARHRYCSTHTWRRRKPPGSPPDSRGLQG